MFRATLLVPSLLAMFLVACTESDVSTNTKVNDCYTKEELEKKIKDGLVLKDWERVVPEKKSAVTYFGGVGLDVVLDVDGPKPRWLDVSHAVSGFPAHNAGIRMGDRITHIDGKPVSGFPNDAALVAAIRGEIGTVVVFAVRRGENEVFDAEVRRQVMPDFHDVECFRIVTPLGKAT